MVTVEPTYSLTTTDYSTQYLRSVGSRTGETRKEGANIYKLIPQPVYTQITGWAID